MTAYTVDVTIGTHSWTFEHTDGESPDTVTVLDGLQFGWSMPTGLGPQQPDPMVAALTISVPDFVDAADIDTGTQVAIEVRFDPDADDPTFSFYGRVSDGIAVPRTDQAPPDGRPGVTISLVAVDYTVDPADLEDYAYDAGAGTGIGVKGYVDVLTQLWDARPDLGTLPSWPGDFDANGPTVTPGDAVGGVLDLIKNVLLVAVDDAATKRVIFAPVITDGLPDIQHYAFDAVTKDSTGFWSLHANAIRRDTLKWLRSKRQLFNTLEITGDAGITNRVSWPDVGHKVITDRLSTICADQDELDSVADFYLPSPTDAGSWTLDQFSVLLSRQLDDEALADLPLDLMPRWYLGPGDAERSSCYSKQVRIVGMAADLNPFTDAPDLAGILDAVSVTIQGGHVTLDTRLRRLQPAPERVGDDELFTFGGYGLAPLGGLADNPT